MKKFADNWHLPAVSERDVRCRDTRSSVFNDVIWPNKVQQIISNYYIFVCLVSQDCHVNRLKNTRIGYVSGRLLWGHDDWDLYILLHEVLWDFSGFRRPFWMTSSGKTVVVQITFSQRNCVGNMWNCVDITVAADGEHPTVMTRCVTNERRRFICYLLSYWIKAGSAIGRNWVLNFPRDYF